MTEKNVNYVNNKEFTQELHEYAKECARAEESGLPRPTMSNYLGDCIIRMARRLATTPRFSGYTYKDEMIQNAILGAVKYCYKFDGTRFNNGFAYVTQILFSHMVLTIKSEKKRYEGQLALIRDAELDCMGVDGMDTVADQHARAIADQKMTDMATDTNGKKSFTLRTGFTREERQGASGTPMDEYLDDDGNKK